MTGMIEMQTPVLNFLSALLTQPLTMSYVVWAYRLTGWEFDSVHTKESDALTRAAQITRYATPAFVTAERVGHQEIVRRRLTA